MSRAKSVLAALCLAAASCNETVAPPATPVLAFLVYAGETPITQTVNTNVPVAPAVRVTTEDGTPIVGAEVVFVVTAGGGVVANPETETDAQGVATAGSWRYGMTPGPQELVAGIVSATMDGRVTFTGTAVVGPATKLRFTPSPVTLRPADTVTLRVDALDAVNNVTATDVAATWVSRDPTIASVSGSGLVTASAFGEVFVVASYLAVTDSIRVRVGIRPTLTDITPVVLGGTPFGVGISATDRAYVTTASGSAVPYSLPSTSPGAGVPLGSFALDVAFSPSGDRAYFGTSNGEVKVVDPNTNAVLRTFAVGAQVLRMKYSPDGAWVYATTTDGRVLRIDPVTDGFTTLAVGGTPNGLAINLVRGVLYVSLTGGQVFEVSLATFATVRSLFPGGTPQGIAVSPSGALVYLANESTGLQTIDAATFTVTDTRTLYGGAFDVLVTLDGSHVYITRYWNSDISVMDATTRAHLLTIPASGPRRMALSAGGTTVLVAEEGNIVRFIR